MNLVNWLNERRHSQNNFVRDWLNGNTVDPDNFPLELLAGDWDEQFDFYIENKHKGSSNENHS